MSVIRPPLGRGLVSHLARLLLACECSDLDAWVEGSEANHLCSCVARGSEDCDLCCLALCSLQYMMDGCMGLIWLFS